jgi:hypothetical protein
MTFLKKWFSLPDVPAFRQSVLGGVKSYLLVRWKKRWPIAAVTPFFVVSWAMTADPYKVHQQLRRTVIGAVIFVVLGIGFPFRWGGEDWEEPKT